MIIQEAKPLLWLSLFFNITHLSDGYKNLPFSGFSHFLNHLLEIPGREDIPAY